MNAADLFVRALENEGVEYIFGVPGEENLRLLESISKSSITLIVTRHEQGAGFMAATYGRLTGKPGVCLSTLGPGATNLVTAAAYAQLGGMPMLMITGQKPIKRSKQGHFQIINTVEMFHPLTKLSKQLTNGNHISAAVRNAFKISMEERPGAVHLELPEDIAEEQTTQGLYKPKKMRKPTPDENAMDEAIKMIEQAKHPLLLIGAAANRKKISQELRKFIDKTGIYFFNTQMGKGVVDERHEQFLGTAALSEDDYVHCAIDHADLIINVGHDVIEKPPFIMKHLGPQVIHINFLPAKIDDVYFPQHEVVGDIDNALEYINNNIEVQNHWDSSYYKRLEIGLEQDIAKNTTNNSFPVLPQRLVADVRNVMPDDGIVTLDNGMYKIWFARNYKAHKPNTLLLDNALATMGAGLPSAMMAKLLYPEKKVLAVVGDGGFMMNSQEMETAIRLKLDLTVIVISDKAYGMIKWKQAEMELEDFGLDFENPNFITYAESYGAKGYRINKTEELKKLLDKTMNEKGIHLIEVPIDYSVNTHIISQELKEKACKF